jgi:DNA-binding LacI/PurR family transcriptional regulator
MMNRLTSLVVTGHYRAMTEAGHTGDPGAGDPGAEPPARKARRRASGSASIRDVAAAAGVSYQTVSRVINEHPSVRESTRQLVWAVIDELRFRPNRAARALAGGPVQSVTVLTPNTTEYGYTAALRGIEESARDAGFAVGVRVLESADPDYAKDAVARAIEPAGSLIFLAYDAIAVAALAAVPPDVPVAAIVEVPVGDEADGQPWVWIDDRKAARDATEYLLGLGHHTVQYVQIPSTESSQRLAGWRAALRDAGAPVPEPIPCDWGPRSAYAAGRALASDPDVTAVLAGNDDLALGVFRAMHEAGRDIPGSMSVVGFDDTPMSEFLTPSLTTARLDFAGLGRVCFATLLGVLDPGSAATPIPRPEPQLVIRESTGPPRRLRKGQR